ncbi:MAG: hypothetical protein ABIJ21_04945 [Nanoarchaeota archaeon]
MKCELCSQKVEETFLKKPLGTYWKDSKSKKKMVCQRCQKAHSPEEIKTKLG